MLHSGQHACVPFSVFFRKSTLLPKSITEFSPRTDLTRDDVTLTHDTAYITVRHTKTIQFGERILQVPLPRIQDSILCPLSALSLLYKDEFANIPMSAPMFSYPVKDARHKCITHSSFVHTLRSILSSCGIDASKYSGHSFRRGGASFAFACGIPAEIIKLQGDWRSSAYEKYISTPVELRRKLSRVLSLHL